ncbi:HDOD domain-containing protein [Aliarcobacter skirrowii]|uniref:HDOD domain-containing protein n=1 Tax=Aliarcobacter skirrowii TaxID=28200 RepID=A0A2U2BYQ0_9BACT|nr:HDOD domain-containing protein [Aliarcobacter skirrowii]MDX3959244.1 HDOD domain-containing protein [Aliarcobacter skirrowii]MDX4026300.1 HDOD domain-containing protein [Aliarcobacter skirrowii]MDX4058661.1 HDOD domain-containing protein [Aliarcobacter skirrowii]PWE19566.1 HDOD domain-containing protein [Aliarcobacter skirrowii]PWE19830.1 HDOD domain-containing protein [Aliarcobacter skirrowii]
MQLSEVLRRVESLAPLPRTIIEIEQYRKKEEKEIQELYEIIKKDALLVTNLLKIANSAMFGFRSKVETPLRAITLLGINFTISVAISTSSQKLLISSLSPYGLSNDDFMKASNIALALTNLWLNKVNPELKDKLLLPALLQDIGKYIISDVLILNNKESDFYKKVLENLKSLQEIEKDFFEFSSSYVTAHIFKHWNLSQELINTIEFVDDVEKSPIEYKQKAMILDVIKTASNIKEPLSEKSINMAIKKAKEYKLNDKALIEAINTLKTRLENENIY